MSGLRQRWASGATAFGAFCSIPSSLSAEALARAGFDFVVLDAQHGGPTTESLLPLVQAVEPGGAVPLVRVPWNDPATIMRALDIGAAGVIVPMVGTREEAQAAVAACRYPPEGIRSFGRVRGARFSTVEEANRDALCIVMVETADGLRNTEDIVTTPGVDGVFVGAVDLSLSLGLGLDSTGPVTVEAVGRVLEACRRHDVVAAAFVPGADKALAAAAQGFRCIAVGGDGGYLRQGAERDVAALRSPVDGKAS